MLRTIPIALILAACAGGGDPALTDTDTDASVACADDDPRRRSFYRDADGDGFGDPEVWVEACVEPEGYTRSATDCDDTDPAVFPGAPELCNGRDDDCDGAVDELLRGTGEACPAESCRAITDERDVVSDTPLVTMWLRDDAGAWQATCFLESRSRAWTVVSLRTAAERGWIALERVAGPGRNPTLEVRPGPEVALGPTATHSPPAACELDILRASIAVPFPFDQMRGSLTARFKGGDGYASDWGATEPTAVCDGAVIAGIPGEDRLKGGGEWGNGDGRTPLVVDLDADRAAPARAIGWEFQGAKLAFGPEIIRDAELVVSDLEVRLR